MVDTNLRQKVRSELQKKFPGVDTDSDAFDLAFLLYLRRHHKNEFDEIIDGNWLDELKEKVKGGELIPLVAA